MRVFDVQPLFARAHTFARTDDFYGLLQIPFVGQQRDDVDAVTVNVGDTVEFVPSEPRSRLPETGETYR